MKYKFESFVMKLFLYLIFSSTLPLFAQDSAVTLKDCGTHFELILDYTTGVSHYEMGKQIAQNTLPIFPNLEQLADNSLAEKISRQAYNLNLTMDQSYELSRSRMNDIMPQVPIEYLDEMDGIASLICSSNICGNDGKLSKEEIYMSFLSSDIFETIYCSSISIFGSRSASGSSITARLNDGSGNPDLFSAVTQSVITIKNKTHSICMIGGLSVGTATAFNDNGIFAALHSSTVSAAGYSSKNKRSYLLDIRYVLENFSTSDEVAEFLAQNSKNYVRDNLIQITDKNSTRILENNFSGDGTNVRCALRCDTSALNPGITWEFPNAIATSNAFLLAGNHDNYTDRLACTARWNSIKNQLQLCGDKVDWNELKDIASFDNGDGPDLQETGDIYNIGTNQIVLFQPDNLRLEIAFRPRTDILPEDPIFEEIPNYITTGVEEMERIPTEFKLKQNYPNPFNPLTVIGYTIGTSQLPASLAKGIHSENPSQGGTFPKGMDSQIPVNLKVYDMLGREVATLVDEEKSPGYYQVRFDGSDLSAGVYIYKLRAGNFTAAKKLMLIK